MKNAWWKGVVVGIAIGFAIGWFGGIDDGLNIAHSTESCFQADPLGKHCCFSEVCITTQGDK
jgi:hypothetical protein